MVTVCVPSSSASSTASTLNVTEAALAGISTPAGMLISVSSPLVSVTVSAWLLSVLLRVTVAGIFAATILGVIIGISRLSGNWIVNKVDQDLVLATWGTDWTQADVNRDGTINVNDLITVNGGWGKTHGQLLLGDVTGDCVVDRRDQDILLAGWGDAFRQADLNRDATVNVTDLVAQLGNWGNTCE